MTVLSVVREVCGVVGILKPTSLFAAINANRTAQEMLDNANEMAQRIGGDYRNWTMLRKSTTMLGDGVTEAFNIPADYKRMLQSSHVWRSTDTRQPMRFIPDTDEWLQRRAAGDYDAWGEWTIYGGQMHIAPVMGVGTTARYSYLDKNTVALASGGFGDRFMADDDTYRLDERILKLGMIWNWKSQKGSPYAEDMGTYSDAIAMAFGSDSPAPVIIGSLPMSANARIAYPWTLPTS
jgi:hypothetical protein